MRPRRDLAASSAFGLGVGVGDYDVGSPFGERYFTDATDDPLARDVRDALEPLPQEVSGRWALGKGEPVGLALAGRDCTSPSVVWHSQALASLFEVGYSPTSPCTWLHLDILQKRLRPGNYRSPEDVDVVRDDWVLKCRHLTWVLACLAEFQPTNLDHPDLRTKKAHQRLQQHRDLVMRAYGALVGDPDSDTPAAWAAPRQAEGEWWWSEYYDGRHANLLNTIYAVLGVCRAERHGFHFEMKSYDAWGRNAQLPSALVAKFISGITVTSAPGGPRVAIAGPWREPWARRGQLPASVTALLCLTLTEYGRLMLALSESDGPGVRAARQVFAKAQRLGHALVQQAQSRDESAWPKSIDAFFQQAVKGSAWYTHSASLGARAVLESGAVAPHHPVVREAFATLAALACDDGRGWIDPSRPRADGKDPFGKAARAGESKGYAPVNLHGRIPRDGYVTANSVHAAAMAYSALRRALGRNDPRAAFETSVAHHPACPFGRLILDTAHRPHTVTLVSRHEYSESTKISQGTSELLQALVRGPADVARLLWQMKALADGEPALQTHDAVRSRINQTNRFFGFELIRAGATRSDNGGPRYELACKVEVRPEEAQSAAQPRRSKRRAAKQSPQPRR